MLAGRRARKGARPDEARSTGHRWYVPPRCPGLLCVSRSSHLISFRSRKQSRAGLPARSGSHRRRPSIPIGAESCAVAIRISQGYSGYLLLRVQIPPSSSIAQVGPRRSELCGKQQTTSAFRAMSWLRLERKCDTSWHRITRSAQERGSGCNHPL